MPTVKNPKLTLVTTNNNVEIQVSYDVDLTDFDVQLAKLGLVFHEHIDVIDDDGSSGQEVIQSVSDKFLPHAPLDIKFNKLAQTVRRTVPSVTVGRKDLDVDTGDDEIKVRIRIHASNMPPDLTEDVFTTSQVLLGDVA
jgi:hypothetical protein